MDKTKELLEKLNLSTSLHIKHDTILKYLLEQLDNLENESVKVSLDFEAFYNIFLHMRNLNNSNNLKSVNHKFIEYMDILVEMIFVKDFDYVLNGVEWYSDHAMQIEHEYRDVIMSVTKKRVTSSSDEMLVRSLIEFIKYIKEKEYTINTIEVFGPIIKKLDDFVLQIKYCRSTFYSPFENGISFEKYKKGEYFKMINEIGNNKYEDFIKNISGEGLVRACAYDSEKIKSREEIDIFRSEMPF